MNEFYQKQKHYVKEYDGVCVNVKLYKYEWKMMHNSFRY